MSGAPFLSIVTRAYRRPRMLAKLKASLAAQTCRDFEHLVREDEEGRGIRWANASLAGFAPAIRSLYVYILDDDNVLVPATGVAQLRAYAMTEKPPWIMVRARLGGPGEPENGVWPRPWGERWRPQFGAVDTMNLVVRSDVWRKHIAAFGRGAPGRNGRGGDYSFAKALWEGDTRPVWLDLLLGCTQRISHGKPETGGA